MSTDWLHVGPKDVVSAFRTLSRSNAKTPSATNTFIHFDGRFLPAKQVLRQAHHCAVKADPGDFSGGEFSARLLGRLGFTIERKGRTEYGPHFGIAYQFHKLRAAYYVMHRAEPDLYPLGHENNAQTVAVLTERTPFVDRASTIVEVANTHFEQIPGDDYAARYEFLRKCYLIHPSLHECEMWPAAHSALHGRFLFSDRVGIKSLTRHPSGRHLEDCASHILRCVILVENFAHLRPSGALFSRTGPGGSLVADCKSITRQWESSSWNLRGVFDQRLFVRVLRVAAALLERTDHEPLLDQTALIGAPWVRYAPCAINEGPNVALRAKSFPQLSELVGPNADYARHFKFRRVVIAD